MKKLATVILLLFFIPAPAFSQASPEKVGTPPASNSPQARGEAQAAFQGLEPEIASRGEMVTVSGHFPKAPVDVVVELKSIDATPQARIIRAEGVTINEDGTSFGFVVPRTIRLGKYDVVVSVTKGGKKHIPVAVPMAEGGSFAVVTGDPIKIDAVYPVVGYPVDGTFGFKIIGKGFGPLKEDNVLDLEGIGAIPLCDSGATRDCVNEEIIESGREIQFSGLPLKYRGVQKVRVRVGDEYSEKPITVTLSRIGRRDPLLIAVGVLGVIVALIAFLLWGKDWTTRQGRKTALLSAILLDKETDTYSLSKLQFYLWTAAALFGYIYLTVSRSLVQGNFEFADIPENLPGILLVAVSTSAVAIGITSTKGAKGAGDPGPSLADLVTTGGLIAAERLQFLVWTLTGVAAFIFLTVSTEPGTIENLPAVPERFLYLMGISSFGYLGGKLARKPGPVITQIEVKTGSLILQVHGANLSADATFKIDDKDINPKLLDEKHHPDGRPEIVTKDETPGFAKVLRLVIASADPGWLEGEHGFTITNADGQKAVATFGADEQSE